MRERWRTAAVVLLVLGGLGYADWVLQLVVPVDADLTTSFISELSAAGQPHHVLFRAADLAAGVLLGAGALAAWLGSRRWASVWAPLVVLAACTVFETISPLEDSYTFGASLPEPGTGAWWAKVSEPHGVSSLLETVAYLVVLATCSLALRRSGALPRWRRPLVTLGIVAALCGALDAALTASLLLHGSSVGVGLVQRLGVTLTALWLALAPTGLLLRDARHGSLSSRSANDTRRPV